MTFLWISLILSHFCSPEHVIEDGQREHSLPRGTSRIKFQIIQVITTLTLFVMKPIYTWLIRSTLWLLMPLPVHTGRVHQQAWYLIWRVIRSLSSTRTSVSTTRVISWLRNYTKSKHILMFLSVNTALQAWGLWYFLSIMQWVLKLSETTNIVVDPEKWSLSTPNALNK